MVEIELKFQLPESQKKAVLQRLKKAKAQTIHLQAKYYDTPDRMLAKNGIAIRLRQEGENWVQTFKAAAKSHLHRIEEEINLGQCAQEPTLDLSLYTHNKTVQKLLDKVLKSSHDALQLQFQTDVQRHYYVLTIEDSLIEICLDDGEVRTPSASGQICEVEFELKQGSVAHLIEAAKGWVDQYGLWLDVRSKAERGSLLAMGQAVSPAVRAKSLVLASDLSTEQALQLIVANCLEHLLPNSAAITDNVAEADHIHQARVAIRRLRTALKHFGKWSKQLNPQWQAHLTTLFRQLGATRDLDVMTAEIMPQLAKIGAPALNASLTATPSESLSSLFSTPTTVNLVLELLSFAYANHQQNDKKPSLKSATAKRLQHLHQQVIQDADQFNDLALEARHMIRKRAKQLRYSVEFVTSLYSEKQIKQYLKHLQPVLDDLGKYNDLAVAEGFFKEQVTHNSHFWFALGWCKAQQQYVLVDAEHALKSFAHSKTFW